ncbi:MULTISPECIES: glycine cleavage system protein GcvH [Paenibacillus]|uniref:Glycine cleavage system H protein n=1 Tax=Paenibacillus albilobatus TaxID=2716884 RepID=A0A919XM93_9BACL|nr:MULTISPECIES: glycine cleavage system protein GcvH [Paenibacillus]MDR9853202.1 glycine cleavage system protein GcvH [Paenibacillus sp. VCA1]GIO34013.1 glycine cleavage system H protein [Paenibacillus albilobatus]
MSNVKENRWYSKDHEWVEKVSGNVVRIGISDFAQHQLGDIVFVELPEEGASVQAEESIGTIESVKTVSDLFCPVSGQVTKINPRLGDEPELVNDEPYDAGWMAEIEVEGDLEEQLSALLSAEQYAEFLEE